MHGPRRKQYYCTYTNIYGNSEFLITLFKKQNKPNKTKQKIQNKSDNKTKQSAQQRFSHIQLLSNSNSKFKFKIQLLQFYIIIFKSHSFIMVCCCSTIGNIFRLVIVCGCAFAVSSALLCALLVCAFILQSYRIVSYRIVSYRIVSYNSVQFSSVQYISLFEK
jgi:hypothetical protein